MCMTFGYFHEQRFNYNIFRGIGKVLLRTQELTLFHFLGCRLILVGLLRVS